MKGNPKTRRPLSSKLPVHLVTRAARGGMRLPKIYRCVNQIVVNTAKKHGVTIYEYANVGNHLHLVLRITHLHRWPPFIREFTGKIGLLAKKTLAMTGTENFWLYRPYTRVIASWNKPFKIAKEYIHLNSLEAEGSVEKILKHSRTCARCLRVAEDWPLPPAVSSA